MSTTILIGDLAAAEFLHVHKHTIINLKKRGKIPYTRVGRRCFYNPDELSKFFYHPGKEAEK